MTVRTPLNIRNTRNHAITVIVEPWATEYELPANTDCEIVAVHPTRVSPMSIEPNNDCVIVTIELTETTYEYWSGGMRVD